MGGGIFSRAAEGGVRAAGAAWRWLTLADIPPATFSADESPARPIDRVFAEMLHGAGRVGRADALSVPPVLRGRNLLAAIATLPLRQLGPDRQVVRLPLLEQIDPDIPNVVTLAQTVEDLLFEGTAWWRITAFGADGYPVSARHLDHGAVTLQPISNGTTPAPLPSGLDPRAAEGASVYVDGREVPWSELIRFDSPNPGILKAAGRAIRRALLLAKASEMYAGAPTPLGFFTPVEGVDPAEDNDVVEILDQWEAQRRKRATAYVPAALKYNPVDVMSPADLQLVELHKQIALEIANALGLDPEDLGVSTTSRTYQNGVDRRQDRVNDVLSPYMRAITDRLSMPDVTKRGYLVRFDLDDYLKADPATRAQVQATYLDKGVITVDEVRADEGLPELTPAQRVEIADRTAPAVREPAAGGRPQAVAAHRDTVTFADTADGGRESFVFEGEAAATFAVDETARTIEGIVVPWNGIASKNGRRFRFERGSLKPPAVLGRNKFLRDHDRSQVNGKLIFTEDRPEGQFARYKIGRGVDGDRALALAADEIADGLSVGVDNMQTVPDPQNRGVHLVTSADWYETSQLALPAFDDARVSAVAASRDEGDPVPDTDTQPQSVGAPTPDLNAAFAAFMASYQPPQPTPEPRPVVNPSASLNLAKVNDGPLYRFDGKKAQRCFTADIASGAYNDPALRDRAEKFIADALEATFANITVSNVAGLNPTINRPDLYVPSLHFTRRIGSMVTGGVVDELTTQRLPKFSSSSGLAATHVQGTEPTDGAFAATTQDVTPAPISGRVTVNREVIDQGGTPQADQVIWQEMIQFYGELLEKRLVDALQALSLSDTPIVGTDGDLQAALVAEFAGLQFIAGGDRYRGLALNQDLYTAVLGAVDGDGRSLFPTLNPANAIGSTAADFSNVRVGSKVGVPAWALASANGGPDKSFLFVPESVYQWFSPPRRINLDAVAVATVGIGIWGYSAEFISRNADVIQLAYTAS